MRKIYFSLLAAVAAISAQGADTGRYEKLGEGVGICVSPNGQYVVGYEVGQKYTSFVLDRSTGNYEWISNYDNGDPFTSGRVCGVNDNGTAVGDKYDENFICPKTDVNWDTNGEQTDVPLHTAFVYKDGETILLDHASAASSMDNWDEHHENPAYYLTGSDGSYAVSINNEETLVLGYITYGGYYYPCYWEWDEAAGAWGAGKMLPKGPFDYNGSTASADNFYRFDFTSDATKMLMRPYRTSEPYQIFTVGEETVQLNLPGVSEMGDAAISPDGRYVAYAIVYGDVNSDWGIGLYDTVTGENKMLDMPSTIDLQFVVTCVSNDKKAYFYVHERSTTWQLWVCDFEQESFASIDDYIASFGVEFEGLPSSSLLYSIPVRISDDGRTILASVNNGRQMVSSYIIDLPDSDPIMPVTPDDAVLFHTSPYTACVVWSAVDSANKPDYYEVTVDDVAAKVESATEADGKLRYDFELVADGRPHTVEVRSVIVANGQEFKSSAAQRTVQMSPRTDVFFFDNVDGNAMYTSDGIPVYIGDDWVVNTSNGFMRSFDCSTNSGTNYSLIFDGLAYGSGFGEYDLNLTSRFLDAYGYDAKDMLLTFSYAKGGSLTGWDPDENCYFAVEYAVDGENWTELFRRNAQDMSFNMYSHEAIDISFLSEEMFQIRFRVHNSADTSFDVMLDYIGVLDGNELEDAPEGLMATSATSKAVSLAWQGSTNEYELGYTDWRWSASWYSNVGTDQPSMIAAIELTPTQLAPYVGKYINSVTTNIYDPNDNVTKAQAKVWVLGDDVKFHEVASTEYDQTNFGQNLEGQLFNYPSYVALDEPVLIEEGKTYRVGVRVYDFVAGTYPLYYSTSSEDISEWGVTDLYSEDEGETWASLGMTWYMMTSDSSTEEHPYESISYCVWPIRVGVAEEAPAEALEHDLNLYAFDVYRDGEKINTDRLVSFTEQRYTDKNPAEAATYQVRAYYRDGRVSELSPELTVTTSGIESVATDAKLTNTDVYTTTGILLYRNATPAQITSLPHGLYIIGSQKVFLH